MLEWLLATVAVFGQGLELPGPKTGPFLSAEYRVLEAGTEKPAAALEAGGKYDVVVTVRANRRQGVKINPRFKSHFLRLEVVEVDARGKRKRALSRKEYTVKPRSPQVEARTGTGKLTVELPKAVVSGAVRLNLIAEIMLCDTGNSWCAQIREKSILVLPAGKVDMEPLPLKYHAAAAKLVVLKKGDQAPDFAARSSKGETVRLADFRGKRNLVLVFGRGYW